MIEPEIQLIPDGGWCPNSPKNPLLVYRDCLSGSEEALAEAFERTFRKNGWLPAWRYTIFDYPHYHSTAHEVIGVYRGEADVRMGDAAGLTVRLSAGDVVVIPAGVSHERCWATKGFQGVGAYPPGAKVDEQHKGSPDPNGARERVLAVPRPAGDPLFGSGGPLLRLWPD